MDHLVRLLLDDRLSREMGEASARAIESLTTTNMIDSHMAVYDSILQTKKD